MAFLCDTPAACGGVIYFPSCRPVCKEPDKSIPTWSELFSALQDPPPVDNRVPSTALKVNTDFLGIYHVQKSLNSSLLGFEGERVELIEHL